MNSLVTNRYRAEYTLAALGSRLLANLCRTFLSLDRAIVLVFSFYFFLLYFVRSLFSSIVPTTLLALGIPNKRFRSVSEVD
jgi:hypothetical protein